ncbi:MAG: terpene cyclase/mutase family protein [Planctomycetaceae bacterium]|nr:terpene cyclase/mutase family protein [Planctomycetaceae bacterium]
MSSVQKNAVAPGETAATAEKGAGAICWNGPAAAARKLSQSPLAAEGDILEGATGGATHRLSQPSAPEVDEAFGAGVRRAIHRTRQWLLSRQDADGSWCAELEGDTILESETILLLAFLGHEDSDTARQCAAYLVEKQLPGGGWAMYPGGQPEISGSVKAYFALKLTGHDPSAEYMRRAREAIIARGGADAVNSFTRFYLALLGQISYDQCPAVPPEVVLLPRWFPVNLYAMSSWSRTMVVPLSIISAHRPVRRIEPRMGIRELFLREPEEWPTLRCPGLKGGTGPLSWDRFFRTTDRLLKWCQRRRILPLRQKGLAAAERWMRTRFDRSDGLGAIYPPIVWSIIALKCLGYPDDSPELQYCHEELRKLCIDDEQTGTTRLQPCKSPVWDTAIAVRALAQSGVLPDNPAMREAIRWLLDRQVRRRGDWSETVAGEPGGWCFEYANDFYPDCDDTAMVLMALQTQFAGPPAERQSLPPELRVAGSASALRGRAAAAREASEEAHGRAAELEETLLAVERGQRWLLAMQNRDGGWGAFDRNNDREFLCHVPFADHNAMIDPSTPDLAGRVLESFGQLGFRLGDPTVDRAVAYVRGTQNPDGSWFGRWGVNYIYGTWQAITGLRAVGVPADDPAVVAGANWLLVHQQANGGWGETPESYESPQLRGQGPVTASQTAWAVLGLLAAGMAEHSAVTRGVQYLVATQNEDGGWDEPEFTGTGFPRVFYLRYHYYPIYFPLMALSQWAVAGEPQGGGRSAYAERRMTASE